MKERRVSAYCPLILSEFLECSKNGHPRGRVRKMNLRGCPVPTFYHVQRLSATTLRSLGSLRQYGNFGCNADSAENSGSRCEGRQRKICGKRSEIGSVRPTRRITSASYSGIVQRLSGQELGGHLTLRKGESCR